MEEFQRKHRVGLLTLLFTDLVGSTQMKQVLGEREAVNLIQHQRAVVRDLLRGFPDAEEIETAGWRHSGNRILLFATANPVLARACARGNRRDGADEEVTGAPAVQ